MWFEARRVGIYCVHTIPIPNLFGYKGLWKTWEEESFAAKFSESASVRVPKHKQSNRGTSSQFIGMVLFQKSQEQFLFKTPCLQAPPVSPGQNTSQLEPDQVKLLFLNCVWISLLTMCSLAHFLPQRHCMSRLCACTGVAADILWDEAGVSEDVLYCRVLQVTTCPGLL